jgi:hypothetical protein
MVCQALLETTNIRVCEWFFLSNASKRHLISYT